MKKDRLVLLLMLISSFSYAQKLKIDNGEIKLDEKTVAYIEGKKPNFKISNLDKNYIITVQLKQIVPVPALPIMEIKNESTGKFNEFEFTEGKFNPFNHEKNVVKALIEHNYLNVDGLNKDVLENFINGAPTGVSAKLLGTKNEKDQADQLVNSYQLSIDDAGVIYSAKANNPDSNDKRIGYIKMTYPATNGELMYEIMDLDNYKIATWYAKSAMVSGYDKFLNQELITYDNKVFKAAFDARGNPTGYKMSQDITAMNIVRVLVGNRYSLGSSSLSKK